MTGSQPNAKTKPGQKSCENCGAINGVRAYVCKGCDSPFKMKRRAKNPTKVPVKDFKTLVRGDIIRVVGGSGPYHTSKDTDERIYLVDRGKYTVVSVDSTGVVANNDNGTCYLYMGKTCPSKLLDSITNAPCKLQKVLSPYYSKREPK